MKPSILKWIHLVSLALGVALFVYIVVRTGPADIVRYVRMMGWGAVAIIVLSALRNVARAASLYVAIDPRRRRVGFYRLMNVMLAGEAIKYLTASGPFLGEPAKAAMMRREVPILHGISSVVLENLIYNLTVFLVMLAGLPALFFLVETSNGVRLAAYTFASIVLLAILTVWLAIRLRWYPGARLLEWAGRFPAAAKLRLSRTAAHVREIETNIYEFYEGRRAAFLAIFGVNLLAHLINVIEVWMILMLMDLPAGLGAGFVIEAATKGINGAFFFVPTRAGVFESGNALILNALGYPAGAGVALALVRKLRALVWTAYGLGVIALIAVRDRRHDRMMNDEG